MTSNKFKTRFAITFFITVSLGIVLSSCSPQNRQLFLKDLDKLGIVLQRTGRDMQSISPGRYSQSCPDSVLASPRKSHSCQEPLSYGNKKKCSSSMDCGIGFKCVKAPLHFEGVCMKKVDEFGIQQFDNSDMDDMGPNDEEQCSFDSDCPIGFYCHPYYKACIKR